MKISRKTKLIKKIIKSDETCRRCNGSGEGNYENTTCNKCLGNGCEIEIEEIIEE
jgi:DnaJ-class molecular chaperone